MLKRFIVNCPIFGNFSLPGLVHQISSPCFVVFQVLLELVVDRPRMVLQKEARKHSTKYASLQKAGAKATTETNKYAHLDVCESAQISNIHPLAWMMPSLHPRC